MISDVCPDCEGRGNIVETIPTYIGCSKCRGLGKLDQLTNCHVCRGKGKVVTDRDIKYSCPRCCGSGKIPY